MLINKAYKFRLYPSKGQEVLYNEKHMTLSTYSIIVFERNAIKIP